MGEEEGSGVTAALGSGPASERRALAHDADGQSPGAAARAQIRKLVSPAESLLAEEDMGEEEDTGSAAAGGEGGQVQAAAARATAEAEEAA